MLTVSHVGLPANTYHDEVDNLDDDYGVNWLYI